MKHLFTIHSHITFLAALATVELEQLDTSTVVLVCGDNYKPDVNEKFLGEIIPSHDGMSEQKPFFKSFLPFSYSQSVIRYLKDLSRGEQFIAYIDLMSVFNRYLVMNAQCCQFHLIEEGIVNYSDYDDFMLFSADLRDFKWFWKGWRDFRELFRSILRLWRGRSIRLLAMPIHPNAYAGFQGVHLYCFSDLAFQNAPSHKKRLLSWTGVSQYLKHRPSEIPEGAWLWIGDTLSAAYGISMGDFREAMLLLMQEINPLKHKNTIYYKFRGGESHHEKSITLEILQMAGFDPIEVKPDAIMEMVFLQKKMLTVCGIGSSLLIYAHLMGHNTYSMYKYLPDNYNISISRVYNTIAKRVGYLA